MLLCLQHFDAVGAVLTKELFLVSANASSRHSYCFMWTMKLFTIHKLEAVGIQNVCNIMCLLSGGLVVLWVSLSLYTFLVRGSNLSPAFSQVGFTYPPHAAAVHFWNPKPCNKCLGVLCVMAWGTKDSKAGGVVKYTGLIRLNEQKQTGSPEIKNGRTGNQYGHKQWEGQGCDTMMPGYEGKISMVVQCQVWRQSPD